ncbi:uncharacterized protein LOC111132439 [Crassostrea virginica]
MGRLRRLVDIVILTFLLKSVNGQAIFDEQTEIEERFLNVATRVMDTKLQQLVQVVEGQLTQKLDAIEKMAIEKMDRVTETLTKDRKEEERELAKNFSMCMEKQQSLVQVMRAQTAAKAEDNGNLMNITGKIMAAVEGMETRLINLEGLGGTVRNLTRDYSNDRSNRERAVILLRSLNESLSNIQTEQTLLNQELVSIKNLTLGVVSLFNTEEMDELVQAFDLMFKQKQKLADPNQNMLNNINIDIVDNLNDSRAILEERLTNLVSTLNTVFNQTDRAVSLSTNKMTMELNDMKKQFASVLNMEQLIRNTTLLFGNKLIIHEEILRDIRNLTLSMSEQLFSRNETLQLMTLTSEEMIPQFMDDISTNVTGMDCAEILKKFPVTSGKDGVYNIIMAYNKLKQVFCDMSTDNGGWTVIQRRVDGSVDFYRNWTEYRNGFGNVDKEYWIGNEILHHLTSMKNNELRVDMQRFNGEKAYALYSNFSVGDENSKYQLTVQGYSGNAGDSLTYSNKMKFSTMDQDNDKYMVSCSTYRKSAWWFNNCALTDPNGQYTDSEKISVTCINWYTWRNSYIALKNIQLMIRPQASTEAIAHTKMGRLQRLVDIVILSFLLKSVNGQAIFDEETEREERFLNLATRVMNTKLRQLAEVIEGQLTQKLDAIEKMAIEKMDRVTETLTKDRKEEERQLAKNLSNYLEKQQSLVQVMRAQTAAKAEENDNITEITGDIMATVKNIETKVVNLEGLGGTVRKLTTDYRDDKFNRERAVNLLRSLNESLSNIQTEQTLLKLDLVSVKNLTLGFDSLSNKEDVDKMVQALDLMFKQIQKLADPNQNMLNNINIGIVDHLNDSRAILEERLTTMVSTLNTVFNQTDRAVSLSTNRMAMELNDMKKQLANLLNMEQSMTNTTLLFGNKLIIHEEILRDIRNLTLSMSEQLFSRNETLQLMTLTSDKMIRQFIDAISTDVTGTDCADILKKFPMTSGKDGVYNITIAYNKRKQVFCDMSTDNGGWTVIQRRVDGSVDFYRNWTEYRNGFGNVDKEYWIGNEILHHLTSMKNNELRVDMQRFNGEKAYALYSDFSVGDENSKYQLTVQGYSGNAGDSLTYSNKMKFSTMDQDNDKYSISCSTYQKSAGWFNQCAYADPNGQYTDSEKTSWKYIYWYHWKYSLIALKKIQLMIRPRV